MYIDIEEPYRLPPKGTRKPIKRKTVSNKEHESDDNEEQRNGAAIKEGRHEDEWKTDSEEEGDESE